MLDILDFLDFFWYQIFFLFFDVLITRKNLKNVHYNCIIRFWANNTTKCEEVSFWMFFHISNRCCCISIIKKVFIYVCGPWCFTLYYYCFYLICKISSILSSRQFLNDTIRSFRNNIFYKMWIIAKTVGDEQRNPKWKLSGIKFLFSWKKNFWKIFRKNATKATFLYFGPLKNLKKKNLTKKKSKKKIKIFKLYFSKVEGLLKIPGSGDV